MPHACINERYGCTGDVGDKSKHDTCANCRSHESRWKHRSAHDIRKRHRNLQVWAYRLNPFLPANVIPFVQRKRA